MGLLDSIMGLFGSQQELPEEQGLAEQIVAIAPEVAAQAGSTGMQSNYQPETEFGRIAAAPQQELAAAPQQEAERPGFFSALMQTLGSPEFQAAAMATSGAFDNTSGRGRERFEAGMNAYSQRMSEKQQAKAAAAREKQQRQFQLEDRAEQRSWQDQQAYESQLWQIYTPESVQAYKQSGDAAVLVKKPESVQYVNEIGADGNTYAVAVNAQGQRVEGIQPRLVQKAAPVSTGGGGSDWTISGNYKYNKRTGETVKLDEDKLTSAEAKELAARNSKAEAATNTYQQAQTSLDAIDKITDADVKNVGGFSAIGGQWTPGTKSSAQKFNQVLSQQFLQNISSMKGMGALSNSEGSKVTAAASALVDPESNTIRTGLSEDFIRSELSNLKNAAQNMQVIAKFVQENGREPSIEELNQISGNPAPASIALPDKARAALGDIRANPANQPNQKVVSWNNM